MGGNFCKIVTIQVDLSATPEKYTVFQIMDSEDVTVKLFKGVSIAPNGFPIIVKRHKFSVFRDNDELLNELTKAINTAIVQTQVEHPITCRVLEMHLDASKTLRCTV